MWEFAKKQKVLEINPRSPLIEGLLRRIEQLPAEEEERESRERALGLVDLGPEAHRSREDREDDFGDDEAPEAEPAKADGNGAES